MNYFRYIQLLLLIVITGIFQSCENDKRNWEIKGTLDSENVVYLYRVASKMILIDSAQIDHNRFTFSGENADEKYDPFCLVFGKGKKLEVVCMLTNGDQMKLQLSEKSSPNFSGTDICEDLNKYYAFKQSEKQLNLELSKELAHTQLSDEERDQKMISYREKVQDLENEKIQLLKSIVHPELNGYLVLKELQNSGVVEKEVVGKYRDALSAEGALTDSGIKVHRIYEFFDAYALSREMEILDTATIRERYNNLNEENKTSDFAKTVELYLQKMKSE